MPVGLLFTFNLQTKFEMSSFIHSRDMAWAPKCRNESHDPDHAHLGDSQHRRLILHYKTKFEDSSCSGSGDISGGVKF